LNTKWDYLIYRIYYRDDCSLIKIGKREGSLHLSDVRLTTPTVDHNSILIS